MMFMMSPTAFTRWTEANQQMAGIFQDITKHYVETMQKCMTASTQTVSQEDDGETKSLKTGFVCFKNMTNANREALSQILHAQINALDLDGLAVVFRELTNSLNQAALKEIDYKPVSAQRKDADGNEIGAMSQIGRTTAAAVNLKNISNSLSYRLAQQEAALGAAYLEAIVLYVKKLRTARVIEDVFGAQTLMMDHIQKQFTDSTMNSLSSLTAYKAGVNVWTEGVIENIPVK